MGVVSVRARPVAALPPVPDSDRNFQGRCTRRESARGTVYEIVGVAIVLVACLIPVFGEIGSNWKTHLPGLADNRLNLNVLLWDLHALGHAQSWRDIWQMPSLYPEPNILAGSEHLLGACVLFAPFYWLTGQPILAFNFLLVLVTILNFLSAYLVARQLLRARIPALLPAVLFAFGSYRLYQILHFQLWTQFPTPLLFLAAVRMTERPSWGWPLLACLSLAGQFYLGMYLGYLALIMTGIGLVTLAFYSPAALVRRGFVLRLTLAAGIAGLLLLPLALPYHQVAQRWGYWRWDDTVAPFTASWYHFFTPVVDGSPEPILLARGAERAVFWGYLPWLFFLTGALGIAWQARRGGKRPPYWLVFGVVMVVVLTVLVANHFHSYRLLFTVVPGFRGLRVPARLGLLALWPCGLVGGWTLGRLLNGWRPAAPRRAAIVGIAAIGLVFLENYHPLSVLKQYWSNCTLPDAAFYEKVVAALPPGATVTLPLGTDNPYPVTGAAAAGWRPTLNIFTGRMPAWWYTLNERAEKIASPIQAAALSGEFRLRGIRFLILNKQLLGTRPLECWSQAQATDGQPFGRIVYNDAEHRIVDLNATRPEARLVPDWPANGVSRPEQRQDKTCASCCPVPAGGFVALAPTIPLEPGQYCATFEVQGAGADKALCEVTRVLNPNATRTETTGTGKAELTFTVPQEAGPEPLLRFRVVNTAGGPFWVSGVVVKPAGNDR
jgi:hypothetical protein